MKTGFLRALTGASLLCAAACDHLAYDYFRTDGVEFAYFEAADGWNLSSVPVTAGPRLLWTEHGVAGSRLVVTDFYGQARRELQSGPEPEGARPMVVGEEVFYARWEGASGAIHRAKLDGSGDEVIAPLEAQVEHLAVTAGSLYVKLRENGRLLRRAIAGGAEWEPIGGTWAYSGAMFVVDGAVLVVERGDDTTPTRILRIADGEQPVLFGEAARRWTSATVRWAVDEERVYMTLGLVGIPDIAIFPRAGGPGTWHLFEENFFPHRGRLFYEQDSEIRSALLDGTDDRRHGDNAGGMVAFLGVQDGRLVFSLEFLGSSSRATLWSVPVD